MHCSIKYLCSLLKRPLSKLRCFSPFLSNGEQRSTEITCRTNCYRYVKHVLIFCLCPPVKKNCDVILRPCPTIFSVTKIRDLDKNLKNGYCCLLRLCKCT